MSSNRFREYSPALILMAMLLVLHALTIDQQSLFVDEIEELKFARGPLWDSIWMPDSMPPMFTLLLRGWLFVFQSNAVARWLSAAIGCATVGLAYGFLTKISGRRVALVACTLFAFSPLQLFFAQMTRGYALMTFWAVISIGCYLMARVEQKHKLWYWSGYVLASALGMYSHYYFAMIPIALGVAWMGSSCLRGQTEVPWQWFVAGYFVMFLLTLPDVAFLRIDFQFQHDLRSPRPLTLGALVYTYFSYFSGYALGPSQGEIRALPNKELFRLALPWLLLTLVVVLPLVIRGAQQLYRARVLVPVLSLITVPLLVIGLVGAIAGLTYNVRFVVWLTFPLSVLLAFAMRELDTASKVMRGLLWTSMVGCLAIFGLANYQRIYDTRYTIEDSRKAGQYLQTTVETDTPLFVVSDYMEIPMSYYGPKLPWHELPKPGTQGLEIQSDQDVASALQAMGEIINGAVNNKKEYKLIYSRAFHGDPKGLLLQELQSRGLRLERSFAGVDVYAGQW